MLAGTPSSTLVTDRSSLEPLRGPWDELAVARSLPGMGPIVQLAWWEHVRPACAELRVVVVRDGEQVVGIAPLFVERGSLGSVVYRFIGRGEIHRVEPLSAPGWEQEVARLTMAELHRVDPRPSVIALESFSARTRWPRLLADGWPGRVQERCDSLLTAMVTILDRPFADWLDARSANFRQQMRNRRRRLERAGATWRVSDEPAGLARDLPAFFALHHGLWSSQGGSRSVSPAIERMVTAISAELEPGRMRLWTMEVDGVPIASQLFLRAGDEVLQCAGGVDRAWTQNAPSQQLILLEIEDACARGDKRIDFGGGDLSYKRRFGDIDDPLVSRSLFPVGLQWPATRARLAPQHARAAARYVSHQLPPRLRKPLGQMVRSYRRIRRET